MKPAIVILAAVSGAILNRAGAWVVHHDHINYNLPRALSTAAETAFALGPELWVVSLVLAIPLAMAWVRKVVPFWKVATIAAFAYLALLCTLGTVGLPVLAGFGATVLLWGAAVVWAWVSPTRSSQPGGAPPASLSS